MGHEHADAEPLSEARPPAAPASAGALLTAAAANLARAGGRGLAPVGAASAIGLQRTHGNAAVARLAQRTLARTGLEGEGGERVIRLPAGTQLYSKPDKKSKAGEKTRFAMPVGLIGVEQQKETFSWGHLTHSFWAVSIGGQRLYVRHEDVAGAVNEMVKTGRAQGADPTLGNASDGEFRKELVKELGQWVGGDIAKDPRPKRVTEKEDAFKALIPNLDKTRLGSATYTTCIDFLIATFGKAAQKSGLTVDTSVLASDAKAKAMLVGHGLGAKKSNASGRFAWHESTPGMTARPKPGDVYVLYMNNNRAEFSHIGFIVRAPLPKAPENSPYKTLHGKAPTVPPGCELWMTVDGGQGSRRLETESFEARYRWYNPATNEIEGEPIQGDISKDKRRWLLGWVDVDQLANIASTPAASKPAAGASAS